MLSRKTEEITELKIEEERRARESLFRIQKVGIYKVERLTPV